MMKMYVKHDVRKKMDGCLKDASATACVYWVRAIEMYECPMNFHV